ncbi:hypothetical protein SLS62_001227 [Diatrype stigma]|uniref:Ribosome biogenesis protein SLX9 n=1 Tax=Diatrype stigma TaxID=117547 RepID=A0AAN9YWA5_9PEZI
MAPTAPTKRRTLREKLAAARASGPYEPRKAPRPDAVAPVSDGFSNTKKDKRQIKHASFVSRIEKVPSKPLKRRRPGKKLKTTLEGLADALPDLQDETDIERALSQQLREGKVRHKSLRSRPGALKRKEKVIKGEVERFGVSLARLNTIGTAATATEGGGAVTEAGAETQSAMQVENENAEAQTTTSQQQQQSSGSTANRWAALRGFISATMEQNPAFIGKQQDEM